MRSGPAVFVIPLAERYRTLRRVRGGGVSRFPPVEGLARALAASPIWRPDDRVVIVAREWPDPAIGIFGDLKEDRRAQIGALQDQLAHVLNRMRYVDYHRAASDCERLAAQLIDRFGREALREMSFVGVPRGGLIVLGLLAYVLELRPEQLTPPIRGGNPVVVVDDCSISGARFREFLRQTSHEGVIFAHLYSHPDLRSAIEARERRVLACLGARDLEDHARRELGAAYPAWRERWWARAGERAYWIGLPDHVCFAWSEPDVTIWNAGAGREEAVWRVVPPDLCLKNRVRACRASVPVQIQRSPTGPLPPGPDVLYAELEGELVLANLADRTSVSIGASGAAMWRALMERGSLDGAVSSLARQFEADRERLERDLASLVDELVRRGFLIPGSEGHVAA